jgi:hypothetical protein
MRRISSGKRIELTTRDIELFKLLYRYQYLRSDFLYALLGGESETRFKERLGDLYHDGRFINRPEQQWQFANCRCMPLVYELDVRGEQVLRDQGQLVHNSPLLKKGRMGACRQFAHQLMICDCLASIELGVRQHPSLRFISWQEILAKAPQRTCSTDTPFAIPVTISHTLPGSGTTHRAEVKAIPDGLFGLEYVRDDQKLYRFFALEADRNTIPVKRANLALSSYLRKILAYRQIVMQDVHRTHLGMPNLLVLTVTTNEQHMWNIMALVKELATEAKSTLFLFKTMSSLGDFQKASAPTPHILTEPWHRVGYEALSINEA